MSIMAPVPNPESHWPHGKYWRPESSVPTKRRSGENGRTAFRADWKRNEKERAVGAALENVAKEVGAKRITAVTSAYVMQRTLYVFPIIGGREVEHLEANLEALEIVLTPEHIKYPKSVVPFDPASPPR